MKEDKPYLVKHNSTYKPMFTANHNPMFGQKISSWSYLISEDTQVNILGYRRLHKYGTGMHAMLSNDYKRKLCCMAAGAPAAFQSEYTRVRPPIIDVFHVRSSSTARHTKCNSRQTRRGSASPQSAHTSSLVLWGLGTGIVWLSRFCKVTSHLVTSPCKIWLSYAIPCGRMLDPKNLRALGSR